MNNKKLLIVFTKFGPRHRAKAAVLQSYDPGAVFLEIAGLYSVYPWENSSRDLPFNLIRLFPSSKLEELRERVIALKLFKTLNEINPDVIMYHGLVEPGLKSIAIWSKLNNAHGILHIDTWYNNKKRVYWKQFMKGKIYNFFYKYAFVSGKYSKEYLISMGFPKNNIYMGCDVVDNKFFQEKSIIFKKDDRWRKKEKLPEKFFLVVARYSPEKDHITLLKAYRKYVDLGFDWKLVLVGDGPFNKSIGNLIKEIRLKDDVIKKGWVSYATMPIYYAFSKCLILPSLSEPWGLVANEAAACGLPLILSDECGCVPELCSHGENGFVFRAGDPEDLLDCMVRVSNGSVDLEAFGEKSRELVSSFTFESWALKVLEIKKLLIRDR